MSPLSVLMEPHDLTSGKALWVRKNVLVITKDDKN